MDDLTFARDFSIFYVVDQMAGKVRKGHIE